MFGRQSKKDKEIEQESREIQEHLEQLRRQAKEYERRVRKMRIETAVVTRSKPRKTP
jgi:hypothetical protein